MSQSRSIDATLNLAQSLSEDFAHRSKADQAEAIRELKQIIANAPERSEFSDTKKFVYTMPLSGAVLLVLAIYIMRTTTSPSWGVLAGMLGLALFSMVLAYQHRNDGATPHMVLTRTELQVSNLSAPLRDGDAGALPSFADLSRDTFGSVLAGPVVRRMALA